MSVTITILTADGFTTKREACLCAQMSDYFGAFVRGERTDWEVLEPDAQPNCQLCDGKGVEEVRVDLRPQVNFSNGNARIILDAMGLKSHGDSLCGGPCPLADLKRGIIRARNVTHPEVLREHVEQRNFIGHGYTRDQLMSAVDEIEGIVRVGERRGATEVIWG